MRKLFRRFKFYFLWKIVLSKAEESLNDNPMNYPFFITLFFSRARILEYYLANYTIQESITSFAEEREILQKKKADKIQRRKERFATMTQEEYDELYYRLKRWQIHLSYSDSKNVYKEAGIDI